MWWADPSGAESIAALRQAGHSVMPCVHMPRRGATGEKQSAKLAGIDQVNERMRTGRLWIVRTPETMPLIRELGMYHYDETKQVEEPVDEDNHACFPAGTLVSTSVGDIPIEQVSAGDLVLTRQGWHPVKDAGLSGINKPIWQLTLSDGNTLAATPDHPVWTNNRRWIRLDALRYGDTIDGVNCAISSMGTDGCHQKSRRLFSVDSFFGDIQNQGTLHCEHTSQQMLHFIERCGRLITDRFQKTTTSIIKTMIRQTTILATSNAFQKASITRGIGPERPTKKNRLTEHDSRILEAKPRLNGTDLPQGLSGIKSMDGRRGSIARQSPGNASHVNANSRRWTERKPRGSVLDDAGQRLAGKGESTMNIGCVQIARRRSRLTNTRNNPPVPASVVSVSDLGLKRDVYAIEVDGPPEFYANGVLVHNCDALRYLVVGLDRGRSVPLLVQPETPDEQRAREESERQADLDRKAELDRMAQEDPFDDRWFKQ